MSEDSTVEPHANDRCVACGVSPDAGRLMHPLPTVENGCVCDRCANGQGITTGIRHCEGPIDRLRYLAYQYRVLADQSEQMCFGDLKRRHIEDHLELVDDLRFWAGRFERHADDCEAELDELMDSHYADDERDCRDCPDCGRKGHQAWVLGHWHCPDCDLTYNDSGDTDVEQV